MDDLNEIFNTQPPPKKSRRKTPKKNLEATVVRDCLKYLHADPRVVYTERRNTGAVAFQGGGFLRFGSPGAADIWCLICIPIEAWIVNYDRHMLDEESLLVHVEIECKRADGKGRLSPEQKEFQEFCERSAIPYFVVTSAEQLGKCLDKLAEMC